MNGVHGFSAAPISLENGVEMQHLLSGGVRIGHTETVALCHWHHQGKKMPDPTLGYKAQALLYGPSFGHELRRFRELYGTESQQLAMQNELLRLRAGGELDHCKLSIHGLTYDCYTRRSPGAFHL